MKLLVVEDSESIRFLLDLALQPHQVTFAENGAKALETLRGGTVPDLIVSDLDMPVMNGWELRRRIEADPRVRDVPFIVFSSSERPPSAIAVFSKAQLKPLAQFVRDLESALARSRPAPPSSRRAPRSSRSGS
jgi:CheY-like chemotaxis protein